MKWYIIIIVLALSITACSKTEENTSENEQLCGEDENCFLEKLHTCTKGTYYAKIANAVLDIQAMGMINQDRSCIVYVKYVDKKYECNIATYMSINTVQEVLIMPLQTQTKEQCTIVNE